MAFDFKSIKSLFIIEEDDNPSAKTSVPATKGKQPHARPAKAAANAPVEKPSGKPSAKFTDILIGALEKNNLPGVDYLEYRQSLQSLEKMQMEEKMRYQSAFAMAQTLGATPQKLIESASHYLDVLNGEEAKFQQALAKQQTTKIEGRKREMDQLDATIREKSEQIKKLQQEIEQHRLRKEKIKKAIQDDSSKIQQTKEAFLNSYYALVSQIKKDVNNMKRYLK